MTNEDAIKSHVVTFQKELKLRAEPAWGEVQTALYIKKQLGKPFWEEKTALVYKAGKGDAIFFRSELDAKEIGKTIKHICGHAAHSAALMGAYLYFKDNPPKDKAIYFIFQPAQEGYPSGALFIVENCPAIKTCKAGFSIHVWPYIKEGEFYDVKTAACDYFEITITGKSTHLSTDQDTKHADAIAVAGKLAQKINAHKRKNFILYIGNIQGGEAPSGFSAQVKLIGDIRALDEQGRLAAYQRLRDSIDAMKEEGKGIAITADYFMGYPIFESNKKLLDKIKNIFPLHEEVNTYGFGGTDDFSLYAVPGVTLHIGTGRKEELHSTDFFVPASVTQKIFSSWVKIGNELSLDKTKPHHHNKKP